MMSQLCMCVYVGVVVVVSVSWALLCEVAVHLHKFYVPALPDNHVIRIFGSQAFKVLRIPPKHYTNSTRKRQETYYCAY